MSVSQQMSGRPHSTTFLAQQPPNSPNHTQTRRQMRRAVLVERPLTLFMNHALFFPGRVLNPFKTSAVNALLMRSSVPDIRVMSCSGETCGRDWVDTDSVSLGAGAPAPLR